MSDPTPDPETVTLQGTYRIGFMPPAAGDLVAGEIYVQVPSDGASSPVIWVGGLDATVVQMAPPPVNTGDARSKPKAEGR